MKSIQIVCAAIALFTVGEIQADPVVVVDPETTHQQMTGWEVTGRLWQFDKAADRFNDEWEAHADAIFDKLVNELGINRFRLEALSGMENRVDYWQQFESGAIGYRAMREHFYEKINDNADPYTTNLDNMQFSYMDYIVENMLLPIRQRVEANGEKLYLNLNYVDFKWTDLRGNIEHARHPEEYAEFVVACFEHLRDKYGLIPDALEVILEADNTTYWNGTNVAHGLLAAKARLNAAGFYPEFIAPSTALASRAMTYFNDFIKVPGAGDALTTFAYHRYDSSVSTGRLTQIANAARDWNLRTGMLEHVGADSNELLDDLIYGNISSWQQYGIATNLEDNPGGYYYKVNLDNPAAPRIYMDKRAAGLSLLFKYVRMGAYRLGSASDDSSITPVAFANTDNSHVLTLRSTRTQSITVQGMPKGTYQVVHASESGTITQKPTVIYRDGDSFTVGLTAGLTTLYVTPDTTPEPTPASASEPASGPSSPSKGGGSQSAEESGPGEASGQTGGNTTDVPTASVDNPFEAAGEQPSAAAPATQTSTAKSSGGATTIPGLLMLLLVTGFRTGRRQSSTT